MDWKTCSTTRASFDDQTLLNAVELCTWVAQTGDLDCCGVTESESGPGRQAEEIDATRRDVLAHLTRDDVETASLQFVEQLGMDQMDLPQVGLTWVAGNARAMFDRFALVSIVGNAETGDQDDRFLDRLRHRMFCTPTDRGNETVHLE